MPKEIKLNKRGTNAAIKGHILSKDKMIEIGFTDYYPADWYYEKYLTDTISFNISIPKDGSDISIEILDDEFLQPYDYQHILEQEPNFAYALEVKELVEKEMAYLQNVGVLEGHAKGEYI